MRVRSFLLGGTVALACALPASASNFNGWYIGLEGGGNWIDDVDAVTTFDDDLPGAATLEFESGWAALATVGYGLGNWYLYNGNPAKAKELFQKIVQGTFWPAFGFIAAEVELARMK